MQRCRRRQKRRLQAAHVLIACCDARARCRDAALPSSAYTHAGRPHKRLMQTYSRSRARDAAAVPHASLAAAGLAAALTHNMIGAACQPAAAKDACGTDGRAASQSIDRACKACACQLCGRAQRLHCWRVHRRSVVNMPALSSSSCMHAWWTAGASEGERGRDTHTHRKRETERQRRQRARPSSPGTGRPHPGPHP